MSRGYFAINELSTDSLYPEQLRTKSQVNILLPASPLGNIPFELPAEKIFFPFFFLDAVVVGGDLTKLSGCKIHRWPAKTGGKKHSTKYCQTLLIAQLLSEHQDSE